MDDQLLHPSRILVVDDQEANALLLQAVLARAGYTAVETMTDPLAVVARCIGAAARPAAARLAHAGAERRRRSSRRSRS